MTSNNLEAIELLKITKRHIQDGYEASAEALVEKAIELLQADEKPTKETKQSKLMELKYRVTPEVNILASVVLDLIDILEEDEAKQPDEHSTAMYVSQRLYELEKELGDST